MNSLHISVKLICILESLVSVNKKIKLCNIVCYQVSELKQKVANTSDLFPYKSYGGLHSQAYIKSSHGRDASCWKVQVGLFADGLNYPLEIDYSKT